MLASLSTATSHLEPRARGLQLCGQLHMDASLGFS